MQDIKQYLGYHLNRYPLVQPQDVVKLLYQECFGPGHMLHDIEGNQARLFCEWEQVAYDETADFFEPLGEKMGRLMLDAIPPDDGDMVHLVHRLFTASANSHTGKKEVFTAALEQANSLAEDGEMPFSAQAFSAYLTAYIQDGMPAVSHSEIYRAAYHPAYRVVLRRYLPYLELLLAIERMTAQKDRLVIAIDGNCGSGKSTLAGVLREIFDGALVFMDEFFLPPDKKTKKRLSEPGGNIDYERFCDEAVAGILSKKEFSYGVYDCGRMTVSGRRKIEPKQVVICEGSYSQHPKFARLYDYKIFVRCSPLVQGRRILARNGPVRYKQFMERWIPMETRYFDTFGIMQNSDCILCTDDIDISGKVIYYKL